MSINWNSLTPAMYAIANANDVDLGVARSLVFNNLHHAEEIHKGAGNLPPEFRPDWEDLGNGFDGAAENAPFNVWIRKCQGNMKPLAAMWNSHDYQGMIDLLAGASDPGPISGPAREEGEAAQENEAEGTPVPSDE